MPMHVICTCGDFKTSPIFRCGDSAFAPFLAIPNPLTGLRGVIRRANYSRIQEVIRGRGASDDKWLKLWELGAEGAVIRRVRFRSKRLVRHRAKLRTWRPNQMPNA